MTGPGGGSRRPPVKRQDAERVSLLLSEERTISESRKRMIEEMDDNAEITVSFHHLGSLAVTDPTMRAMLTTWAMEEVDRRVAHVRGELRKLDVEVEEGR